MTDSSLPVIGTEWCAEGLRFSCTGCGNCCTGPPGYVWFTTDEAKRIAALLGIDEDTFYRQYARKSGRRWSLTENHTEHGYDCIFLDRDSVPDNAVCSIYEARPAQCRSWPFWPENLQTQRQWKSAKRTTPCPGMDKGDLIPLEEIHRRRDAVAPQEEA